MRHWKCRVGSKLTAGSNPALSAVKNRGLASPCYCKDLRGSLFWSTAVVKGFVKRRGGFSRTPRGTAPPCRASRRGPVGHTGRTEAGNTRDVKVERIGPVTIYKRGATYSLYYREAGVSRAPKVDGNLAVARATASKVAAALAEGRPSPIGHRADQPRARWSPGTSTTSPTSRGSPCGPRTATARPWTGSSTSARTPASRPIDAVDEVTVEDFVKWLRGQTRARNGAAKGKRDVYKTGRHQVHPEHLPHRVQLGGPPPDAAALRREPVHALPHRQAPRSRRGRTTSRASSPRPRRRRSSRPARTGSGGSSSCSRPTGSASAS